MIIEIKNKEIELNFGMRFLYELNKKYPRVENGVQLGFGLQTVYLKLEVGDMTALMDIIQASLKTSKYKVSQEDIESFIDNLPDIDTFVDNIMEELKESNATKKSLKEMMKEVGK